MARNFVKSALQGLNIVKPKVSNAPRQVTYESNDIEIPETFLRDPSKTPVVFTPVPFASSAVPEYDGCFAVTIDNILSPEECTQLISLAESSVPSAPDSSENQSPWRPAMISLGPGVEAPAPGYRQSDRIVWDRQEITDRVWERCCQAEGLREKLAVVEDPTVVKGRLPGKWVFSRVNARMRFLKYSPGQFFKPHIDGPYWYEDGDKEFQTHYTLHLYLNDSSTVSSESNLKGGATSFLSRDRKRGLDVNPKAGSVVIFQHEKLFHEGAKVTHGEKFTVRTDILYEWVNDKSEGDGKGEKDVVAEESDEVIRI